MYGNTEVSPTKRNCKKDLSVKHGEATTHTALRIGILLREISVAYVQVDFWFLTKDNQLLSGKLWF